MFIRVLATAALLAGHAAAKTDLAGCVSSQTVAYGGASLIWYVPDTGEICAFLDCGGGRAPPKTTVPGCAAYEGTATYSPSYLPGFGATSTPASSSAATVATSTSASEESSSSESGSASASTSASTSASASASASESGSGSGSASSSTVASITSPPATIITGTVTSSAAVETQTGSGSGVNPSSSAAGSGSVGSSTSSVPTNGAAHPTAAVKGAFGVMAGLAMGVAML